MENENKNLESQKVENIVNETSNEVLQADVTPQAVVQPVSENIDASPKIPVEEVPNTQTVQNEPVSLEEPSKLEAVTIGEVKDKKGLNTIGVFIFLIIAIGIVIALPYLEDIKNQILGNTPSENGGNDTSSTSNNGEDPNLNPNIVEYYELTTANFEFASIKYTNFNSSKSDDTYINFNMQSLTSIIDLSKKSLYLELYTTDNTLLERAKITSKMFVNNSNPTTISLPIKQNTYDQVGKVYVIEMTDDAYPAVTLNENQTLTCTYNNRSIKYTFTEDKLIQIEDLTNYYLADNSATYYTTLSEKNTEINSLKQNEGIDATILQLESSFTTTVKINLETAKINLLNKSEYFAKDMLAKKVKYEAEAMRFTCN